MPKGKQFWKFYKDHTPEHQSYIKRVQEAYHKKECSLCGARALYRAGKKVYCKAHRQVASDWWAKHPMQLRVLDYNVPEYDAHDHHYIKGRS